MFMAFTGQRIEDFGAEDNDAIPWPAQGGHRRFGVSLRVSGRAGPPHAEAWTTCEAVRSPAFRLDSCADGGCARKALPKALGGSQNRKIGLKTPKMAILGLEPRFVAEGALLDFLHEAEGFGGAQRLAAFFEPHFFLEGFGACNRCPWLGCSPDLAVARCSPAPWPFRIPSGGGVGVRPRRAGRRACDGRPRLSLRPYRPRRFA